MGVIEALSSIMERSRTGLGRVGALRFPLPGRNRANRVAPSLSNEWQ